MRVRLTGARRRVALGVGAALAGGALLAGLWATRPGDGPVAAAPVAAGITATATPSPDTPEATLSPTPTPESDRPVARVDGPDQPGRVSDTIADAPDWPPVAGNPEREPVSPPTPTATPTAVVHVVVAGETLSGIADALGVATAQLASANHLDNPDRLAIGQRLVVPGAVASPARAVASSRGAALRPQLDWPLRGAITTYFGEAGAIWIGGHHTGLDLAGRMGDPVAAADAGTVVEAGWAESRGYGNYVKLSHGQGDETLYGHLSAIRVKVGQEVAKGQIIGDVGSTGVSTGPHLHFEVRRSGQAVDPLEYLP